jgi:hypothetical protein
MKGHTARSFGLIAVVAGLIAAGAALLPTVASSGASEAPRELRLVVRDMTFYVEGQDAPNPTLRFRAGEEVRLVLKNDDAGMEHDFAIRGWNVRTKLLDGKGEDAVVFRVPSARGQQNYACTPHSEMMRGAIEVE